MGNNGHFWMLFVFLWFCLQAQASNSQTQNCNSKDLKALEGFMNGLESGISGWGSDVPSYCCNWVGVTCSSGTMEAANSTDSSRRVVGLELGFRRLKGSLSESLADLDQIRLLNLSNNLFIGKIPSNLFNLQNLEVLDLSNNGFSGLLPLEIELPSLQHLDISENLLEGAINAGICKKLNQVRILNLSMNHFFGNVPLGFGNCTSLQDLSLNSNYLSGTLPPDLFLLAKLSRLYLQDNMISGSLSDGIRNLTNLLELDISSNNISGSIPNVFDNLEQLERFSVNSNKLLGGLPISLSNNPTLNYLNLGRNSLGGSLSLNCSAMASLTSLDIGSNNFHGPIFDVLSSCKKLRSINLAQNYINSSIPKSFMKLKALSSLSLSNTSLHNISTALGVLQKFHKLTTLVLSGNFYKEELPSEGSLNFCSLESLVIANCGLTGLIPTWLSKSTNLLLLDLSWNQLGGMIPHFLGELKYLFYLDLSNNSFSGEMPRSLTTLDGLINGNMSSGPSLDFPFFRRHGQHPWLYKQIGSFPRTLNLMNNMLTGPIWPEFGKLKRLQFLDLSFNSLNGPIPSELSRIINLEHLDLSHNNLSGTIPDSLVSLNFLSTFSVAYNQLSGTIPMGGQFLTFTLSSFEGNKNLCGPLINVSCFSDNAPIVDSQKARKTFTLFRLPFGVGMAVGFTLSVTICFVSGWVFPQ